MGPTPIIIFAKFRKFIGSNFKYRFRDIAPTTAKFKELKRYYTDSRNSFNKNLEAVKELNA